jgi:hypothetical protein
MFVVSFELLLLFGAAGGIGKKVPEVVAGSPALLCCSHCTQAVNCTVLAAIGTLAMQQVKPMLAVLKGPTQLLSRAVVHPGAVARFCTGGAVPRGKSNASCLSEPKACLCVAGCHCLGSHPEKPDGKLCLSTDPLTLFAPSQLREIVSSGREAELSALFHNGKEACPL